QSTERNMSGSHIALSSRGQPCHDTTQPEKAKVNPEINAAASETPRCFMKIAVIVAVSAARMGNSKDQARAPFKIENSQLSGKKTPDCGIARYGAPIRM